MLLAIDVGNSHVVFGVYRERELLARWRLRSDINRTADEYFVELLSLLHHADISPQLVKGVVISCVVPPLLRVFNKIARNAFYTTPLKIDAATNHLNLSILCDDPMSVGADRIVNSVAAKALVGAPAVVVDFGTATTFDVIDEEGNYRGGVIAPGLSISATALFEKAAMLPSIELRPPDCLIGRNTRQAMRSGIIYGYVGLTDGIIDRLRQADPERKYTVIATGGLAHVIEPESKHIERVISDLTLHGMLLIAERNGLPERLQEEGG